MASIANMINPEISSNSSLLVIKPDKEFFSSGNIKKVIMAIIIPDITIFRLLILNIACREYFLETITKYTSNATSVAMVAIDTPSPGLSLKAK